MATENDPLLLPTWLQFGIAAVVAVITGVVSTAATALLIALGITKRFGELEKTILTLEKTLLAADSTRFHDLIGVVQGEVVKSEQADDELGRRLGATEQEIAVLKEFKGDVKRYMEQHK